MFFVIAWMGGKCQRRCRKRIEWLTRARPHQPTPPWRGPRKRVAKQWRRRPEPRKGGGAKGLTVELAKE